MCNPNTKPATSNEKLHAANGDANQITTWLSPCAMVNIGLNHKTASFRSNVIYCPDISTSSSILFSSHAKWTVFVWCLRHHCSNEEKQIGLKYTVYKT
jgi:hypothetical protein